MIGDKGHLGFKTSTVNNDINDVINSKECSIDEIENIIKDLPSYIITADENTIISNLKKFRNYRGFTLRQVEDYTGISNCYLSQLEGGKIANPSFATIVKLCKMYSIKLTVFNIKNKL